MSALAELLRRRRTPAVYALMALAVCSFLAHFFFPRFASLLAFVHPSGFPWGFLTYSLADLAPLTLAFECVWLYIAGGDLELRWGTRRFAVFLIVMAWISALSLLLGSVVTGRTVYLFGLAMPLACITVAWCLANPDGVVLLAFVLPVSAKVVLAIEFFAVYVYAAFSFGPLAAFFALTGPALAYLYAAHLGPDRKWRRAVRQSQEKRRQAKRRRLRVVH